MLGRIAAALCWRHLAVVSQTIAGSLGVALFGEYLDGKCPERLGRHGNAVGRYAQFLPVSCPSLPSRSRPVLPPQRRRSPFLLTRLLGEPVVEHGSREADVPADPMAGQAAGPHGLVDPARPDVEIPSGLIWPKQPVVLQRSLCCWCCCFHAGIDPNAAEPANGFSVERSARLTTLACQYGHRRRPKTSPGDRQTTAGEICGEIWPAVREPC
jgi:hypothetical protein